MATCACSSRMLLTSSAQAASISEEALAIRTAANGSSDAFSPRYAARTRFCCISTCSAYAPVRHADDRRGDGAGEDRVERQLVEVGGVLLLTRAEAAAGVAHRQRERVGHEDVLDHDVVGAGAGQADHVPDVVDRVVLARHHERLEVDDLAVVVEDEAAEQHPAAVVAAGGEAPLAGQRVAALGELRLAGRGVRRAQPGRWCPRPTPPAAPRRRRARPATGARRPRWRPSRSSRTRRRCRAPRCRSRPGRPRGRRTAWAAAAGRTRPPPAP